MAVWIRALSVLIFATLLSIGTLSAADLDDIQGTWEFRYTDNGRQIRAVKTVKNDNETTATYEGDKLLYEHVCKIEFIEADGFHIMKWGETEVTYGPQKGMKKPSGSCIVKLEGNKWYHAHGLRADEKNAPSLQLFLKTAANEKR